MFKRRMVSPYASQTFWKWSGHLSGLLVWQTCWLWMEELLRDFTQFAVFPQRGSRVDSAPSLGEGKPRGVVLCLRYKPWDASAVHYNPAGCIRNTRSRNSPCYLLFPKGTSRCTQGFYIPLNTQCCRCGSTRGRQPKEHDDARSHGDNLAGDGIC